jgi:hypothetical protein
LRGAHPMPRVKGLWVKLSHGWRPLRAFSCEPWSVTNLCRQRCLASLAGSAGAVPFSPDFRKLPGAVWLPADPSPLSLSIDPENSEVPAAFVPSDPGRKTSVDWICSPVFSLPVNLVSVGFASVADPDSASDCFAVFDSALGIAFFQG